MLTKVHLFKAMVFPVVMYGCESWTQRKLRTEKLMLLNCSVAEDSWESYPTPQLEDIISSGLSLFYCPALTSIHDYWKTIALTVCQPAAAAAKLLQSCPTLCDPIDGSPPGSTIPGILQARTLEWVATSFSSAGKWKVKVKSFSRVQLLVTPWTAAYQAPPSMGFSRQ